MLAINEHVRGSLFVTKILRHHQDPTALLAPIFARSSHVIGISGAVLGGALISGPVQLPEALSSPLLLPSLVDELKTDATSWTCAAIRIAYSGQHVSGKPRPSNKELRGFDQNLLAFLNVDCAKEIAHPVALSRFSRNQCTDEAEGSSRHGTLNMRQRTRQRSDPSRVYVLKCEQHS